jgi:hypothetical protein
MIGDMRALILGFALLTACSSVSTSYDFDPDANFENLKTYRWIMPAKAGDASDTRQDPLVLKRVQRAANEQLGARGYQLVTSGSSDFCVAARLRSRERTRVTSTPAVYGYGYGYRYWGAQDIDVYQYEEGSIILDVVDKTGKTLMWRGVARAAVPESPTAEQITKLVDEAVQKLIADFPPRKK